MDLRASSTSVAALDFIVDRYARENSAKNFAAKNAQNGGFPHLMISSYEGHLLKMIAAISGSKKIVEIGTLTGYSGLWLLDGMSENGELWTIELEKERVLLAKKAFEIRRPYPQKVHFCEGNAAEELTKIEQFGPFDMVFIDADKVSYNHYLHWAMRNIRTGGVVCADNIFLGGCVYNEPFPHSNYSKEEIHEMRKFNDSLCDTNHFISSIIATVEGMSCSKLIKQLER